MSQRESLWWKAAILRAAQKLGMILHRLPSPTPPSYSHEFSVPAILSEIPGTFKIYLYTPKDYQDHESGKKYPLLLNFHAGGFTHGCGTDDCRWFAAVTEVTGAIVASVDYRLAPEHPFPTAVEDGVDAILWLVSQADRLAIDIDRGIALSGFSSGANLAFTVPLKIDQLRQSRSQDNIHPPETPQINWSTFDKLKFTAIVSWYPPTNYTISRAERNATNPRPEMGLPRYLTNLFDHSYLYPPSCERDILVSPALATDEQLIRAFPRDIWIYTCEYDDLCEEGRQFAERLKMLGVKENSTTARGTSSDSEVIDDDGLAAGESTDGVKVVRYFMIPGVRHGWDKSPNPLWENKTATIYYRQAVEGLRVSWSNDNEIG